MFFIPGWLISMLTFPGVILHEWSHEFFCRRLGVAVLDVKYFRFGEKVAGYVLHEAPKTYKQTFWISIGPLLVNSFFAIILSFVATQIVSGGWLWYIFLWLAISAGMHSFPSDHDMSHISSASKSAIKNGGSLLHYLAFPFVWLVWLANKLSMFWFDIIWAIFLVSLGGGFGSFYDTATINKEQLLNKIKICKNDVSLLSDQVKKDSTDLDNLDLQMTRYKNSEEVDSYNNLIPIYNNLLDKIKTEISNYDIQSNSCNDLIDKYNSNK